MRSSSRSALALAAVVAALVPAVAGAAPATIAAVVAPATALVGEQFTIDVELAAPAAVQVTRADTGAVLATAPARDTHTSVTVRVDEPGLVTLRISAASTTETATVAVADFRIDTTSILLPWLMGYGAQFNHSLFYPRLNPLVPSDPANLRAKVGALAPRLVRVFFPREALTDWQRLASFQQVVRLAQAAGSTIEVTWSGGYSTIESNMQRFAALLAATVRAYDVTGLRWVSLLNEPNGAWDPPVPKETYERMYRAVDQSLRAEGVRDQIRLMGGELVQQNQRAWLDYMVDHMSDVLDAYSVHVYWDYWDTAKLEARLADLRAIDLRTGAKPVYVTEFGVRGVRSVFGISVPQPGIWGDGITPMAATNVNAFQLAWFNILAARLGYPGTVTWDAFNAKYDSGTQDFSCIGAAPEFELRPCFHLLRLFTATTEPGWRGVGVPGMSGAKLVTAYAGPFGQFTVIGLDRRGGQLNDDTGAPVPYGIAGLPPSTTFRLVTWNRDGSGQLLTEGGVRTDAAGVAWLTVPQHAVWALTTHA